MPINPEIKILLVEDAPVMRQMEKKVLNSLGLSNIIEASDGNDAVKLLTGDNSIGLVISDWNMPNMDGFELLEWIRKNHSNKKIPFLMATGRGEKKEVSKAEEAGVSSFISKPFNAQELSVKIEEALGLKEIIRTEDKPRPAIETTIDGKVKLKMAHIQITDHLVLGVLKYLIDTNEFKPKHFELQTVCMSSWNPVAEALESGSVQGACVLAPIAMDLYSYGAPLKLILNAHKNGSIGVKNKKGIENPDSLKEFFKGKSFYIPHTLSIHNMLAHMFFKGIGLNPGYAGQKGVDVEFEVVPPVKMPEFIAENQDSSGYLVAEPLGTKAIAAGNAELQFLSSELWEDHPCCVVTVQEELIEKFPDAVYELTDLLVKAGKFISQKPAMAAEIAVDFLDPQKSLGLKVPLLKNVLTEPKGIRTDNLYPTKEDLDKIQKYMHNVMGVGNLINLDSFVDLRFAERACDAKAKSSKSHFIENVSVKAIELLEKSRHDDKESVSKALLNLEGKYLSFVMTEQEFCIDILRIVEIIRLVPITRVPNAGKHVKGVINLRGKVIPVIDIRVILNLPPTEFTRSTRIIVLEFEFDGVKENMGILVEAVNQVSDISAKDIEEPPSFFSSSAIEYITAIAKAENSNKILIDINKLIMKPKISL